MQAAFPATIAALPPPVDPQARRDLQRFSAPAITANDPVQRATMLAASDEYAARSAALRTSNITRDEVFAAEYRLHTVFHGALSAQHLAPLRQAQANTDGNFRLLANVVHRIDGRLGAIENRIGAMENRLGAMEVGLIGVQNYQTQSFNRRRHHDPTQHLRPLQPLRKVHAGNGPGILGRPHGRLPQAVPVGTTIPSPPFPRTIRDTEAMTLDQIHEVAIMMNDDFGIVHGDDLHECRDKFLRAITGQ